MSAASPPTDAPVSQNRGHKRNIFDVFAICDVGPEFRSCVFLQFQQQLGTCRSATQEQVT